jgi:hypothetical protein
MQLRTELLDTAYLKICRAKADKASAIFARVSCYYLTFVVQSHLPDTLS